MKGMGYMDKESKIMMNKVIWKLYIQALQTGEMSPNCIQIHTDRLRDDYHDFKTIL